MPPAAGGTSRSAARCPGSSTGTEAAGTVTAGRPDWLAGLAGRDGLARACRHRDRGDGAAIHRQVRCAGRQGAELARPQQRPVGQPLAVPQLDFAADQAYHGLSDRVPARLATGAGREHDEVQAEGLRAGRRAAAARLLVTATPPALSVAGPLNAWLFAGLALEALGAAAAARPDDHALVLTGSSGPGSPLPGQPPADHAHAQHLSVPRP